MKSYKIVYLLILINFECNRATVPEYSINGQISGFDKEYIYLTYDEVVDSCLVTNGIFSFKGKVQQPVQALLLPKAPSFEGRMTISAFMLENSNIDILASYSKGEWNNEVIHFLDIDSISGSNSNIVREEFEKKANEIVDKEIVDSLKTRALFSHLKDFITLHSKSAMSGEILREYSAPAYRLSSNQISELYNLLDSTFQAKPDLDKIRDRLFQRQLFVMGGKIPEIRLPDQYGNVVDLQDISSDVLLIEFWAAWCLPCRQSNPELLDIYHQYKKDGFEILGVSIDKDIQKWKSAIKKDGLDWIQVIDIDGIADRDFGINAIPYNLLINRNKEIIAIDIKLNDLREVLRGNL